VLLQEIVATQIGKLKVISDGKILLQVSLASEDEKLTSQNASLFVIQLKEYFSGTRTNFDIAYQLPSNPFARKILQSLAEIPYSQTISYAQLAVKAGYSAKASRAVGTVMRKNLLPIILPCHRVVKSDGCLGNYSLGKDNKKWLIDMESK